MDRSKTRKAHKKSRNGCLPCKGRHVKCDEQRPNCANCVKQGTICQYRSSMGQEPPIEPSTPITTSTPSTTEGSTVDQALPIPPTASVHSDTALNLSQLRLFHHYTTVTAQTLAHNSESTAFFTTNLVQTAFSYPFLLHTILALAALHLSRLENPYSTSCTEYCLLADKHYDAALSNFRVTIRDIDHTNWEAVLMFAGTQFPYSWTTCVSAGEDLELAFNNFLTNIELTRRIRPMVTSFYNEMRNSKLSQLIPDDVKGVNWEVKEAPTTTELVQLRRFSQVVHQLYPPDIIDAYGYAIHVLELSFAVAAASSNPPSDALLKIWIHFVPDRYVELLSERQPGSLIILAHYAVLLRRSERYWFLEGVAEQILNIANTLIPTEWKTWLEWPSAQIRGSPKVSASG
ncbi:hypothetical protein GQ44DRAFT_702487 [Phaeosphaeriaceae sp. PMI808]|nr:hypothetical protein GQ44DRAFT_702487 [Phaeosphaeriaceae sp. PMI808]